MCKKIGHKEDFVAGFERILLRTGSHGRFDRYGGLEPRGSSEMELGAFL